MKKEETPIIKDKAIQEMLEKLKTMPERIKLKEQEYFERKEFVKKVFGKAVEDALGIKVKE